MEKHEVELPRVLQQLWGWEQPARPGPKPTFHISEIGAAAVRLADAGGLGAVSMSKVAAELGFTTMSLYRYVEAKDDLYVVMLDEAFGKPAPVDESLGWREQLTAWAVHFRDALVRHPWVLQVPVFEPPLSPQQLDWMEAALRAFAGTQLTANDKLSSMMLVNIYVRGTAQLTAHLDLDDGADQLYGQRLAMLATPDRYPTIAAGLANLEIDYTDDFTDGLDVVLDGIEQLIERRNK
ncbi:TetR/AcrR family transcriptional regulator [Kribbella sp. NPDC051770]|uniref:TetR/AcrR family transcriptional regulator n=1 Tax=Kribbella sp. NPDC051770 TaxID=3155413 RepID=UPI0034157954